MLSLNLSLTKEDRDTYDGADQCIHSVLTLQPCNLYELH